MNVHEFQAKDLLRRYGVRVPRGKVAESADEVFAIAEEIGGPVVVKAQIHAGGRGKAGGVKLCNSPEEARDFAAGLLGRVLVTHQTGPAGRQVRRVLVEEATRIARELYLGLVIDRASGRPAMIACAEGGVEIEEVAARSPEKILRETIDPAVGLLDFQARKLAFGLGVPRESIGRAVSSMKGLYRAFVETDVSLAEINPLVVAESGEIIALDAKMTFDDNALFRQKEVLTLRDLAEEDPKEVEASKYDLSYISLDGNIGCMVNGANFLDVGGGATTEKVTAAFKILLSDPNVRAVLVNIFGGIMKCDVIATGVVKAAKEVRLQVPLVVRLEGTNVDAGKKILRDSGLDIISATDMADAARKAVEAAGGRPVFA